MGGIEMRPVTAGDLEALAVGRCTCGCEDDGPGEVLAPGGRPLPVGAPPHVAEMSYDFAANTDGRWKPPWPAFVREMDTLAAANRERFRPGRERPLSQLSPREKFVVGAWSAMTWTLGQTAKPPLWQGPPVLVSNASIGQALQIAEHMTARADLHWYAEGVRAWLRWITAEIPQVVYPPD